MKTFRQFLEDYEVGADEDTPESAYDNTQGARRWGNIGAGILPIAKSTGRLLVNFRSKYVNEPHQFGVWGGKVDSDENIEKAARREFVEETGYTGSMELIPAYVYQEPGFEYHNFLGIIPTEFKPIYNWETEGHEWVSLDNMGKLRPLHFGLATLLTKSDQKIRDTLAHFMV